MIRIILITGLVLVMVYALSQRSKSRHLADAMSALSLIGIALVFFPEVTNSIAEKVGVGRGADLVLYCFILISLAAVFNIHLRIRSFNESITELARSIAISSAIKPASQEAARSNRVADLALQQRTTTAGLNERI